MAKVNAVWGLDIGHSALKAMRCVMKDGEVVVDAFDFIEYPKILSQPEADPDELIQDALEQFLSRNSVRGDKVAISVPGQSGLAKFFKPPPVDAKKIPDIVKYEARQQIPFDLQDVIWDYQRMAGGQEVDGFALDTEVGLFAMKREQVHKWLRPFQKARIEVDIVQLSPLSIYNFITYDQLAEGMEGQEFDPDSPPESVVVLSMGTDSTDLVVTNGYRVWQRSIPLGGNHFTKQLTKDLKLTFAKAEHLKRNAREAEDPKTLFQAMRPVFNDLVTEVQRSVTFFQQIDRKAKIRGIIVLGNTTKLPGLKQYLGKNLGYDVLPFEKFKRLSGEPISTPSFKDNSMSFGVCYGLCLQALEESSLTTNLVPREILTERLIRSKKPWTVAGVALLLLAFLFNYFFIENVHKDTRQDVWESSLNKAKQVEQTVSTNKSTDGQKVSQLEFVKTLGEQVAGNRDRRLTWLELLKAVNESLPHNPEFGPGHRYPNDYPYTKRPELYVDYVESKYFDDLSTYFTDEVKKKYLEGYGAIKEREKALAENQPVPPVTPPADGQPVDGAPPADGSAPDGTTGEAVAADGTADANAAAAEAEVTWPTGPGWVIELKGHHYFNGDPRTWGATHVRNTLLWNLEKGTVALPVPGSEPVEFTMKEMGIGFPLIAVSSEIDQKHTIKNPEAEQSAQMAGGPGGFGMPPGAQGPGAQLPGARLSGSATLPGGAAGDPPKEVPLSFKAPKYDFVVQFCWQETLLTKRLDERKKLEEEQNPTTEANPDDVVMNP
ncbi:MAG: pilus assembly protein PilM [Planctomycetales bacterium]|nr:pilus assembly protein PilM [Planctomycetales bacterium]